MTIRMPISMWRKQLMMISTRMKIRTNKTMMIKTMRKKRYPSQSHNKSNKKLNRNKLPLPLSINKESLKTTTNRITTNNLRIREIMDKRVIRIRDRTRRAIRGKTNREKSPTSTIKKKTSTSTRTSKVGRSTKTDQYILYYHQSSHLPYRLNIIVC